MLQLEFPFTLPCGLLDAQGQLHRNGLMRRATTRDELAALADPRAQSTESYAAVLLLSRVIVSLGGFGPLSPTQVEGLFASDFSYLQRLYLQINAEMPQRIETACPSCGAQLSLGTHLHSQAT